MNIQDLQQQWNEHGNQDDLVTKLFKESRHLKIDILLKRNILNSILFVLLNLIINIYVWSVLIFNFDNISARYIGILLLILTYVVLFKNIRQLDLIYKINNSKPVVETQKLIGKLKVERVRHNRFIFVFSNLFFWSVIILIYKWDLALLIPYLWEEASIVVIIHVGFSIIWLPLSIWILNKYDEEKYSKFWSRLNRESYLSDQSLNTSLNDALSYLKEIEDFVN
ncbi:hypothetical protein QSE00_19050 [Arenibacter sp. M-2]|uniref:hypothetical protein n=1 Tax=Arenibacter sp. M-2 TaxID=3053612 RepID=UPI002570C746|nr:hypothetical protein [Arenibacter sp. M-2]MDL5513924.1 hypothetical protein [Arenibacter sp. M-2]|tara:strand:- start:3924 stop:4595 length:672 start_codon:yes stop_codon:yes gene_type:complete